jgi:hypothetical protein
MSTPPDDALLKEIEARDLPDIQTLARLYDSFANALDPFSERRDAAEKVFTEEVTRL